MRTTVYSHIAGFVTVGDLRDPLGSVVRENQSVEEAWMVMTTADTDPMNSASLVLRNQEVIGSVWLADLDSETKLVGDCMEVILPAAIISANTPALYAVKLLAQGQRELYFVLHRDEFVGTLTFSCLSKPLFRICLLALTLELEQAALDLLMLGANESWAALGENRRTKAIEVYQLRFRRSPDSKRLPVVNLLECTCFADKGQLLRKRSLLSQEMAAIVKSHFAKAEKIRNMCAHPGSDDLGVADRVEFAEFVRITLTLIHDLEAATERAMSVGI